MFCCYKLKQNLTQSILKWNWLNCSSQHTVLCSPHILSCNNKPGWSLQYGLMWGWETLQSSIGRAWLENDIFSTEQTSQISNPCWTRTQSTWPTMKQVFSHDGHFTLQFVHLSSCTTQGQIQGENDYPIVKVSTTTTIIATHNEVTIPLLHCYQK